MMAQSLKPGASEPPSDYERIERGRRRRKFAIVAAMGAVGGIGGGIVGARESDRLFDLAHPWPPLLCVALAASFLLAVAVGNLILRRQIDEVERMAKLRATHAGAMLFLVGYPVWFLLWKGRLPSRAAACRHVRDRAGRVGACFLLLQISLNNGATRRIPE